MAGIVNAERCSLCFVELDNIEHVKQLPCGKCITLCLSCIEGEYSSTLSVKVEIECVKCSGTHQIHDLKALPSQHSSEYSSDWDADSVGSISDKRQDDEDITKCDRCKDELAVSYCSGCNHRLCTQHEQTHADHFEGDDDHKLMPIQQYLEKPGQYTHPKCKTHPRCEIALYCENCECFKCGNCSISGICLKAPMTLQDFGTHKLCTLADINAKLRSEFEGLLEKCSQKIEKHNNIEKRIWTDRDKLDEECDELRQEVDANSKQLFEMVEQTTLRMKSAIDIFSRDKVSLMETQLEATIVDAEYLNETSGNVASYIGNNHIVSLLSERENLEDVLKTNCEMSVVEPTPLNIDELKGGLKKYLSLNLDFIPDTVVMLSKYSSVIGGTKRVTEVYDIMFTQRGELLAACEAGILLLHGDPDKDYGNGLLHGGLVSSITANTQDYLCIEFDRNSGDPVDTMLKSWNKSHCEQLPFCGKCNELPNFKLPEIRRSLAAAHGTIVVATSTNELIIHDHSEKGMRQKVEKLSYNPYGICFDRAGQLLVMGSDATLRKYSLEEDAIRVVWSLNNLSNGFGLGLMGQGHILVICNEEQLIHVVSDNGRRLKTITHPLLPKVCSVGIAVDGDVLAIPNQEDGAVLTFKIM